MHIWKTGILQSEVLVLSLIQFYSYFENGYLESAITGAVLVIGFFYLQAYVLCMHFSFVTGFANSPHFSFILQRLAFRCFYDRVCNRHSFSDIFNFLFHKKAFFQQINKCCKLHIYNSLRAGFCQRSLPLPRMAF